MVISFTPSQKFIYGLTHTEVDRSEVGRPLEFEVDLRSIVLNEVVDGRVRVTGLPDNVIYLTDSVTVTSQKGAAR